MMLFKDIIVKKKDKPIFYKNKDWTPYWVIGLLVLCWIFWWIG